MTDRCEAIAVRSGLRCHRKGFYDPVNDGIRCDLHEARGGQCEAFCTGANGRVGRRCKWTGIWDNYHQRWLCEFHARAAQIAFTERDALLILRDNQRRAMRDWRERKKEAA